LTSSPSVAIVILNWNGGHYLEKFLPSVLSTTYANYKIVVADNASTDDSIEFLKTNFPQVKLIALSRNFGFAKGYNEALKKVEADYFAILNSDVEVTASWLQPIVELLEKNEKAAACQPKILAYNSKNIFEYAGAAGGWIDAYGYPFARGRVFEVCEEDKGQYDATQEIFWATGAAMVIKTKVYHQLNGFDEYFFAHMEEIDLCWRIQLAGYKIYCCPQSIVYHVGGGTLPKGATKKTFLNYRNNQIMLAKNLPWGEKWWKIPFRMGLDQISALKELLSGEAGYFRAVIKAHFAFLYWIFLAQKRKNNIHQRPLKNLSGVYNGSIIWKYFIRKKKLFSEIVSKEAEKGAKSF
jgi:GT2 family glycosyltransferase